MFDAIAPRYDVLNHVLSAGIDRRWRTEAIRSLRLTGHETVLDVCTGTGDLALEARRRQAAARVIGVDFSGAMLALGLRKVKAGGGAGGVALIRGDAVRLPVADRSADAATIGFGIRNVQEPEAAIREIARTLRPGGRLAILEFGVPNVPGVGALYRWYFTRVLPRLGRAVSGHAAAYSYLPASVGAFPPPEEFARTLESAGFTEVRAVPLTFGVVYLYVGVKR